MLFSVLAVPTSVFAQGTTASLGGTVTDSTGAVIPGAKILLKNEASDDQRDSVSNGSGVFSFAAVPTGTYDITITAPGFAGFKQTGIHLDPDDQRSVRDIHLTTGSTSDAVTVESAADAITLDSGEQSSLISSEEIKHLSVEGRDVTELFKILPGFAISNGGGGNVDNRAYDPSQVNINGALGSYAANGTPLNGVALLSDGADITDPGNFGAAMQNVNYEQVAEVKVQTSSFSADTARGPIVVNAVGKAGGNAYHGSLYVFARTSQLNSTDWIANYTGQQKPPDHQVYPGFTFGGPILIPGTGFNHARKLTFFVGAEDYAQKAAYAYGNASSAIQKALVPTAAMRTGDFSAAQITQYLGAGYQCNGAAYVPSVNGCPGTTLGNISAIPSTGPQGQALVNGNIAPYLDPLSKAIFNELPLPNIASNGQYNFIQTNLINNDLYQVKGRVDYAISDRNKLFGVYSVERGAAGVPQVEYYSPSGPLGGVNTPGGGLLSTINSQIASFNLTTIFSPTLTNEFYAAGAYLDQNFIPKNLAATQGNPYKGVFNNGSTVLPELQDYGNDGLPLQLTPDGSFGGIYAKKLIRTVGDNVSKTLGKNFIRAGIFYQLDTNHQVLPFQNTNGAIALYYFGETYADPVAGTVHDTGPVGSGNGGNYLANFAEGHVFSYSQTNIAPAPNLFFFNLDGYIQDHLRLTQRITIDAGLRLEHFTPWGDAHNVGIPIFDPAAYAAGTNPALPGFLYHAIDNSVPVGGLGTRWAYVEPRAGFAWDTYGKGQTIVRGGFGIYRAHDSSNDASNGLATEQGQRSVYVAGPINLSSVSSFAAPTGASTFTGDSNATGFMRGDDEQPEVMTYNVSVDQRLAGGILLEVAYVGNKSTHILNDGSSQPTTLDDINALPVGSLFGAQPARPASPGVSAVAAGPAYPLFTTATTSNATVGGLDQAHIDAYRKYQSYEHLYVAQHNLYANYNALQVGIAKQSGKAHMAVNYTFSKALGVLGGYANGYPADPFNYANDYQEETYDHRDIFNAAYSYQFGNVLKNRFAGYATNGWEVSGISNYQSGANLPSINNPQFGLGGSINVAAGASLNTPNVSSVCAAPPTAATGTVVNCSVGISNTNIIGTPDVNLQPLIVGGPHNGLTKHEYINQNAFALPSVGTNGSYRYGFLPGPGFFNTDITAAKSFRVTEKSNIQLRVAAFNFINHGNNSFTSIDQEAYTLNFNNASNAPSLNQALNTAHNVNSGFGYAPLREGRRIMELGLRYDF